MVAAEVSITGNPSRHLNEHRSPGRIARASALTDKDIEQLAERLDRQYRALRWQVQDQLHGDRLPAAVVVDTLGIGHDVGIERDPHGSSSYNSSRVHRPALMGVCDRRCSSKAARAASATRSLLEIGMIFATGFP